MVLARLAALPSPSGSALWPTIYIKKKDFHITSIFDILDCSFKMTVNHSLCFQVPPGLWQESGCRPQWPPERGQTWLGAWWETGPRTSTHGRPRQPHTTCPPSSLSAEAATAEVTSSSASREAPSQQPLRVQKLIVDRKINTRVYWKMEMIVCFISAITTVRQHSQEARLLE